LAADNSGGPHKGNSAIENSRDEMTDPSRTGFTGR